MCKAKKKRICTVGNIMRAVESSAQNTLNPFDGWTNKFVFPPHDFTIPTCMITNFIHLINFVNDGFCFCDMMKKRTKKQLKNNTNSILTVMLCSSSNKI
jgi:S-adenosylmethionine:tRNA ribosyltransferase-isomerase